jgi:hypothetical protein
MRFARRTALMLAAAVVLAGCATQGVSYKEQQARLPQLAAGNGRIFIYRNPSIGWAVQPSVYLNGVAVGAAVADAAYLLDRPKGSYEIAVKTEVEKKVAFLLEAGEVKYVRLALTLGVFASRIVPELVSRDEATKELLDLRLMAPAMSPADNQATKVLGVTGVGIRTFSPPEFFNANCVPVGDLQAPGSLSHTQYIQRAFEDQLRIEGAYAQGEPRVTIGGKVNRLDFSSLSGYWQIDLTLDSSNGSELDVSEHYEFQGGFVPFVGIQACMNTADAFVRAVQNLVNKAYRSSGFAELLR